MIKCKRIVSLGFLSLAILTVAACNGKKEMVRMGSGRVEITFMNWASEAEQASTQATLDQFNKMQDRIKVNLLAVPMSEYMTKLNTMTASNTLPDCGLMQEPVVLDWAASGMLVDVSDMYKEDPNRPLEQLTFRYKGQPVAYSAAIEPFILYYSKDTFDATGIPYPPAKTENAWTWDEFLAVCKKLTKDRSGKHPGEPGFNANDIVNYGIRFHTANNQFWTAMTMSNGGGFISQDGKELLINKPETIEAIQSLADLGLKHHVAPRGGGISVNEPIAQSLLNGTVAMAIDGQWAIGTDLITALDTGLRYGVGVLPKFKEAVTTGSGGTTVVYKTTKYPKETMEFVRWFAQEDNYFPLIETGVYTPVHENWYHDEALIKRWADNKYHPPVEEYKTAVVDYILNNYKKYPWFYFAGISRLEDMLDLKVVWSGEKTAKQAIDEVYPSMKSLFDELKGIN